MSEDLTEYTRIPPPANGIQVNFCKNPKCSNFGVPASTGRQPRRPGATELVRDSYKIGGSGGSGGFCSSILCKLCKESPPLKSNQGIDEELQRLSFYLSETTTTCPNAECNNHQVDIKSGSCYQSFGKTKSGSQRYRCKSCRTTFSIGAPAKRQRLPHKNVQVFKLLVNKMPLKRICEVADISMPTLYDKIDFIHRQCMAFVASRERELLKGMTIRRLYVAVDRQEYIVNWTRSTDRRNVALHAVGSADNTTGYVFGLHLNFDSSLDMSVVEEDAVNSEDYQKRYPFRKYARLWLQQDYTDSISRNRRYRFKSKSLDNEIEFAYDEATDREDVEVSDSLDENRRLPSKGIQVHLEYTLYAHFLLLHNLFGGVEKVRFFLDQESGIRAACLSAFVDEVKNGNCDAFYVRINKDLKIDERKKALAERKKEWKILKKVNPGLSDSDLKLMLIKECMEHVRTFGKWQDRWVQHPFPNMSEPEKAVCCLTDTDKYDDDHMAWLYNKASLHAIDRFFMQARRRISLLERPISTPSSPGRKWFGYSPYNPAIVSKVLDIFRVFYNYVECGEDKQTPAMRLGLAKGRVSLEDVLYFL